MQRKENIRNLLRKPLLFLRDGAQYLFYLRARPFYRYYFKKHPSFYRMFSPFTPPPGRGFRQCDRRTVVDTERKFIFTRLAKVASSALTATLAPGRGDEEAYRRYRKKHLRPSGLGIRSAACARGYFKFVFVRCPYDRVLSAYLHKIGSDERKRKSYMKKAPELFRKYGPQPSFREFCLYLESGGLYDNKHWIPQRSLMAIPPSEYDFIGKIENMDEDLKTVSQNISSLEGRRISRSGPYTGASGKLARYYDKETAAVIRRVYREDFESFGYPGSIEGIE